LRTPLTVFAVGLVAGLIGSPQVASQDREKWTDLFSRDLRDWTRSGAGKSPWTLTADRVLVCKPTQEMYLPEREFGDGTFQFQYRFLPDVSKPETVYKAGLSVRRSTDRGGCRISLGENCGSLEATIVASSDREKKIEIKAPPDLSLPAGEWNEIEVRFKGRSVEVLINGKEASSFDRCDLTQGLIALEVEGFEMEFKSVRWKEAR
jgi:Domain of Unknown Function (DUF1080)